MGARHNWHVLLLSSFRKFHKGTSARLYSTQQTPVWTTSSRLTEFLRRAQQKKREQKGWSFWNIYSWERLSFKLSTSLYSESLSPVVTWEQAAWFDQMVVVFVSSRNTHTHLTQYPHKEKASDKQLGQWWGSVNIHSVHRCLICRAEIIRGH